MSLFLFILAHHPETADPDLLERITNQLDSIFGIGAVAMVAVLGVIIIAIPAAIFLLFMNQKRHDRYHQQE
jgi:hypothetical protein